MGDLFEGAARRAFYLAAGKRMDHGKSPLRGRAFDFRESGRAFRSEFARLPVVELDGVARSVRQRGQKFKGQTKVVDEVPEFRTVAAIPGNYRIEGLEAINDVFGRKQSQAIKSRCNNGLSGIRETRQRDVLAGAPDLGVVRAQGFERGQAHDEITNSTWPNQKASQMNHQL